MELRTRGSARLAVALAHATSSARLAAALAQLVALSHHVTAVQSDEGLQQPKISTFLDLCLHEYVKRFFV